MASGPERGEMSDHLNQGRDAVPLRRDDGDGDLLSHLVGGEPAGEGAREVRADPLARGGRRPGAQRVTSKIFISYRREDCPAHAGRICDRLRQQFGKNAVFMDVDTIMPGTDFVEFIGDAVASCDALIALIGDDWLECTDREGRRRLDDEKDFVRIEIEAALEKHTTIIPVLVENASMPSADALPHSLAPLARYQALELSDQRWSYDVNRLVETLEDKVFRRRGSPSTPMPRRWWRRQAALVKVLVPVAAVGLLAALMVVVTRSDGPPPELEITANRSAPPSRDAAGNQVTYGAENAIDPDPTTAWRVPGDGRGAILRLRLPERMDVRRVGLLPGYAKIDPVDGKDRFLQNRRILRARYRLGGQSIEAQFEEKSIVQFTDVAATTDEVVIEILDTTSNPERDFTAISDIKVVGTPA